MRQAHGGRRFGAVRDKGKIRSTRGLWGRPIGRLLSMAALLSVATSAWGAATYVYDANNRLIGVLNSTGNSTRYVYDDIGNLIRTDSIPSSQLALLGFAPEHGSPGTAVTIWGQGFSTTANANAVSFNGAAASVISATANQLQTTVPAGATTGAVSVTVGGSTTSSTNAFVVDDTGLAPAVTSVSPTMGAAGTTVTLIGTHMDPVAGATAVTLNGVPVMPTTITDTSITFATPTPFGSGRFLVTTPYGQATAGTDFTTIAPDFASSSYTVTPGRIGVNGAAVTVKATSNENVTELLFDASSGDWLSLQASGLTGNSGAEVEVYDPRGIAIGAQNGLIPDTPSVHFLQIPANGTYTMVIWPGAATTFSTWSVMRRFH